MPLTAQKSLKYRVNWCVSIARVMDIALRVGLSMSASTITQPGERSHHRFYWALEQIPYLFQLRSRNAIRARADHDFAPTVSRTGEAEPSRAGS